MGYLPSYAKNDYDNALDVSKSIDDNYQAIELLGRSKNIDKLIENASTSSDPYLTKEDIFEKHMFGRVYENGADELSTKSFSLDEDVSLNIFSNLAFYMNMPD